MNEETTKLIDSFDNPVPDEAFIVRSTEISEFTDCRRKWFMQSQNGMSLESKRKAGPLVVGIIMHRVFEAYRLGKDLVTALDLAITEESLEDAFEDEEYKKTYDLLQSMTAGYEAWMKADPPVATPVEVEKRLLVPMLDADGEAVALMVNDIWSPLYVTARLDGLEIDDRGNYWVAEDKTISKSANLDSLTHLDLDAQATINILVARQVWPERAIIGSHYTFARKQATSPRVKNKVFNRIRVLRNQAQINTMRKHLAEVSSHMYATVLGYMEPYPSLPSTSASTCEWKCSVRFVCESMNRGEDWESLLDELFVSRQAFVTMLVDEMKDR